MNDNKKCYKCQDIDNLRVHYKTAKRVYYVCRPCYSQKMKNYYDKYRALVFAHYGNICRCCGESNQMFLSIDHINNDGYAEKWATGVRIGGRHLYLKIYSANYPDTYQLLCMNCNYGKRMNNGICPHKV